MRFLAVVAGLALLTISILWDSQSATGAQAPDGKTIFRFDTFGDEQLWTKTLQLHEAIQTLTPALALKVGLKVDAEALPPDVIEALKAGKVNLDDPAVTLQLLSINAVVGVMGKLSPSGTLASIGITCALCHSTVDNSLAPGIGRRLDGWANRDLNVGAIVALSPALDGDTKAVLNSWGPGKYDPRRQIFDGKNIIPLNNPSLPVVIPSIFGLKGVGFETFTGDGPISYWNAYVGISQMGGHGSFSDQRIGVAITQNPDQVTPKLPLLLAYQLGLPTPPASLQGIEEPARRRGEALFNGAARCASCHIPPLYTDVMNNQDPSQPLLHAPTEVGQKPEYADRSATKKGYRTTPLRALWQHPPYFHDGGAADLRAVVDHYDGVLQLKLTERQKTDLVEFLRTL